MNKTLRIDGINTGLIIASCVLAHYFPYHLVLFSYAVLGPAHYLTQISWMHDRKYFVSQKAFLPLLIMSLFLFLALAPFVKPQEKLGALDIALIFGLSLFFVMPPGRKWKIGAGLFTLLFVLICFYSPALAIFISVIVPTVIHIYIFTACFMLAGAIRSGKWASYIPLFALFACGATFLIPSPTMVQPDMRGLSFFKPVAQYLQMHLPVSGTSLTQFFGFLSFAYTYHYLNWFSKAEIIHWHHIPTKRLALIALVYIASLMLYFADYSTGFLVIFFLAQIHIYLEFPLNLKTFYFIGERIHSATLRRSPMLANKKLS